MIAELLNNYEKIDPRCRHFLDCGGCSLQDFPYADQLAVKKEKVMELLKGAGLVCPGIEIYGKDEFGYRTRMDYVISPDGFGLRRKRRFDEVVDLQECHLIDNKVWLFLRSIYNEGLELGLVPYDLKIHEGEWRYLSVRVNEKNELMLISVTKRGVEKEISNLKSQISKLQPKTQKPLIKSIYHIVNDGLADVNFGEIEKYWGDEYLTMGVAGLNFQIGPNTFFQNNLALLDDLVESLLGYIDKHDWVLDLYCGVGTLSLPVAQKCRNVLGVELLEESIELAEKNACLNNIENAEFVAQDVDEFLVNQKSKVKSQNFNTLLLDPPRKGLEKSAEILLEYDFEKVIYMSCNPLSLARDLVVLSEKYEIEEFSLWDLYPQTPHVECLVNMKRR